MQKKNKGALNLAGLVLFLLALPFFFGMGGGAFAMAEVLPGQAAASFLPYTEKTESLSAKVFGTKDVEFSQTPAVTKGGRTLSVSAEEMARLRDFSYLRSSYYIIDSRTALLPSDIDAEEALEFDFSIKKTTKEPKILIFHTHAHEGFADSDMSKGLSEGIWGAGEELKRILEEEYGIGVLHDDGQYDVVNGKGQITGAYERMVTNINGKPCAQVMFFNGLCRLNKNGTTQAISGLENPYLKENLAFSLQMKKAADALYPGFSRKIYLNAYRFSLHMLPRSTLIEVGAQTNTKAEIWNAMEPLAKTLASVLTEQ